MYNIYGESAPSQNFMGELGGVASGPGYRSPVAPPVARGLSQQVMGGFSSALSRFVPGFSQNGTGSGNMWGSLLGKTDTKTGIKTDGWGGLALGAAQGVAGAYLGMKQYGMAKQQLAEAKRQFNVNYEAQRKSLNTRMQDRQAARVASNPEAYQSVGAYMKENRI